MSARDTTPDAAAVRARILRAMSPERKGELAVQMAEDARAIVLESIRARHPEYDEAQVRFAFFRHILGDELFRQAWPDAPLMAP